MVRSTNTWHSHQNGSVLFHFSNLFCRFPWQVISSMEGKIRCGFGCNFEMKRQVVNEYCCCCLNYIKLLLSNHFYCSEKDTDRQTMCVSALVCTVTVVYSDRFKLKYCLPLTARLASEVEADLAASSRLAWKILIKTMKYYFKKNNNYPELSKILVVAGWVQS